MKNHKFVWIRIDPETYAANMPSRGVPSRGVVLRRGNSMCYVPDTEVVVVAKEDATEELADLYQQQRGEIGDPDPIGVLRQPSRDYR